MATQAAKTKGPTKLARIMLFISGLQTSPPGSRAIVLQGKSLTVVQVIAALQPMVTALQAVLATKGAWSEAVAAGKALLASNKAMLTALRPALILAYGSDAHGLAACGIVPKVAPKRTAAETALRNAKAEATRKKNGTGKYAPKPTITVTDVDGTVIGGSANLPAAAPAPVVGTTVAATK
jgi:hypothetical protein